MKIGNVVRAILMVLFSASVVLGQGAQVAFGGLKHDSSLPVEISADQLQIDQANGTATFSGGVIIGQGEMRISAGKVEVIYATLDGESTGNISELLATGGVTIVNGSEAAEARQAKYSLDNSKIVMIGDVILTQGRNALSAARMVIDLDTGFATMDGRVKTILQTGTE